MSLGSLGNLAGVGCLPVMFALGGAGWLLGASAPEVSEDPKALLDQSLAELMQTKIVSASFQETALIDTPAAVAVITGEDIRRSGATTIAESLRLAPGTFVGQLDSHQWAISIRGFADTFANKLLVLMDGRTVYTPLYSGVFWDSQDTYLSDIDRIEVVRGPGGSVWGANAVNGVVNVVTKSASDTQGLEVQAGAGTYEQVLAAVRYGDRLGEDLYYRVYAKYNLRDHSDLVVGGDANDGWQRGQAGFRMDWEPDEERHLTLQGDAYLGEDDLTASDLSLVPPYDQRVEETKRFEGGNLLARWTVPLGEASGLEVQSYYDHTRFDIPLLGETRDTFDFEAKHHVSWGERQKITWGGGYRLSRAEAENSEEISLHPASRTDQLGNLFVEDEIGLVPDRLDLTLGSKFEHNNYTGFEFEPSARLAWRLGGDQTLWASVNRAVRTPSDMERSGRVNTAVLPPAPPGVPWPTLVSVLGNPEMESETLMAYEVGYRTQVASRVNLDLALYYNEYSDLRAADPLSPSVVPLPVPHVQAGGQFGNFAGGSTYGGELSVAWQVADPLRLQATYSLFLSDLETAPYTSSLEVDTGASYPRHMAYLRSTLDLSEHWGLDLWLRYCDDVQTGYVGGPTGGVGTVPAYVTLDARLSWRPTAAWEFALVGRNLVGGPHEEFRPTYVSTEATVVSPSVYGLITFRY